MKPKEPKKYDVKKHTFMQRMSRYLARKCQRLIWDRATGNYILVNEAGVLNDNVDVLSLAKEIGALKSWETVDLNSEK
jgi:hypothetical protein